MAIAEVPKPGIKPSPRRSSFERTLASARSTMMFSEIAHLAVDSFRANKVRFLLTMLGMIIGSASIILVVTLGLTGKEYAHNLIASIGPNMIEMEYQGGGAVSGTAHTGTPDYMTIDDMHAVLDQVPGIVAASPMRQDHVRISVGGGIVKDATIIGVSPQYKRVRNLRVLAGRFFDDQDARSHTKVAVIVEPFAKLLFGSSQNAVGRSLSVRGIPFTIIGVFKESVETFDQTEVSNQTVLIPYEVSRYFTGTNDLTEIFFTMRDTSLVISAKDKILNIIKSRHKPTSVYTPFTLTEVLNMADKIATMLTIVLTLAAAITLIVSGVGIMNSMLANVSARYREIGIRKALGATGREIHLQFLTEAVFLSLSGGIIGTLVGLAVTLSASLLMPIRIPISIWSIVIALGTSILIGVFFGTVPARSAARLDPVQTLKYE